MKLIVFITICIAIVWLSIDILLQDLYSIGAVLLMGGPALFGLCLIIKAFIDRDNHMRDMARYNTNKSD